MTIDSTPNNFRRQRARWLVSSLLVLIAIAVLLICFASVDFPGSPWEVAVLHWLHTHSSASLDALALAVTQSGSIRISLLYAGVLAAIVFFQGRHGDALFALLSIGGAGLINAGAKLLFQRARPTLWLAIVKEDTFSFPSGHAMASMAVAVTVILLTWESRFRFLIVCAMALYVICVGLTRMYLGVHFPSDIVAGWSVSLVWVIAIKMLLKPNTEPAAIQSSSP